MIKQSKSYSVKSISKYGIVDTYAYKLVTTSELHIGSSLLFDHGLSSSLISELEDHGCIQIVRTADGQEFYVKTLP
jgi:hypothetical protein